MNSETQKWIDGASYEQLLRKYRFSPVGDPFFQAPKTYDYYMKRMNTMRAADPDEHVRASKAIGW